MSYLAGQVSALDPMTRTRLEIELHKINARRPGRPPVILTISESALPSVEDQTGEALDLSRVYTALEHGLAIQAAKRLILRLG